MGRARAGHSELDMNRKFAAKSRSKQRSRTASGRPSAREAGAASAPGFERLRGRASLWLGPVVIGVAGIAMLAWTWRTWPDVLVDFGRELYVPWRLAAGQVLYRDLAYFNGPLSPYWNSLWFRLFGVSLTTLIVSNFLCVAALTAMLYAILREVGSTLSATMACVVFVLLFAFGNLVADTGNYNFMAPYSHDLTHGLLLAVAALFCLLRYHARRQLIWIAAMGLTLGLVFLTKVEVVLAGGAAAVTGLALTLWAERPDARRLRNIAGVFLGAAAVPVVTALILFSLAMPLATVLRFPLGHWFAPSWMAVTSLPFYQKGMGTEDLGASVKALATAAFWYLVLLGPPALLALWVRGRARHRVVGAVALFIVMVGMLGLSGQDIGWRHALRPLPVFTLVAGVAWLAVSFGRLRSGQADRALILRLSMIVFAEVLLLKMVLNARIFQYGFALAMPATLLLVVCLAHWIPAGLDRLGGYGGMFRAAAMAVLLVAIGFHILGTGLLGVRFRSIRVGTAGDAFLADSRALYVIKALEELGHRTRPDQTLLVLPEGVMINYLSRRVNPTPYFVFLPLELALFGEDQMLSSMQAHPADYVMLVHRDTSEYGVPFFGRDYGRKLYAWIMAHYRPLTLIGAPPLQDKRFGILLLRRYEID
jgi:hypothetical protein